MNPRKLRASLLASAVLAASSAWITPALAAPVFFTDAGANAAAIQDGVDTFRAALGNPNNGNAGPQAIGRREINWDGGGPPVVNATPPVTPFTVFQNTRGATFTTPGTGLTQAADTGGTGSLDTINPTYAAAFTPFSLNRLFTPIGSNITEGTFSVPGTGGVKAATVSGFGAVFTDVDLANTTTMEFFGTAGNSLGIFNVPVGGTADGSLSFLGVIFTEEEERIARVRITTGNSALGPNDGGGVDVVVMDDFLYAEPLAIAEPTILWLIGLALIGVGLARRQRQR
jgi:hypothetical protein